MTARGGVNGVCEHFHKVQQLIQLQARVSKVSTRSVSLSLSLKSVLLNHCTKWAASFGEDRGKKIIGNDVSPSLLLSCLIFISLSVSCSCSRSFSLCLVSNSLLLSLTKVFFHLRLQEANNKTRKYFSTATRGDSALHMVSKSLNLYFILF